MKIFRILVAVTLIVFVVSFCVSSIASAQGQGQGQAGLPALQAEVDAAIADIAANATDIGTNYNDISELITKIADLQSQNDALHVHYAIGDEGPAGGIVFYVTGLLGLHGLEAAPNDQDDGSGAEWGCYGTAITGADSTAVGTGAQNTADILAGCSEAGTAAELADAYTLNGYSDWFLPSKDELNLLYGQRAVVGGFANFYYRTSSEVDSYDAWSQHFGDGAPNHFTNKNYSLNVRVIREF